MKHAVFNIVIPGYKPSQKPDYDKVGGVIDKAIKNNFLGKNVALRCLSIQDHPDMSPDQLIEIIDELGTDKYDPRRKMSVAHDFYSDKGVDVFATPAMVDEKMILMGEVVRDFYEGAIEDRGYPLKIDLITVYDLTKLKMIPIEYEDGMGEEAFRFKNPESKSDAILGFIKITQRLIRSVRKLWQRSQQLS